MSAIRTPLRNDGFYTCDSDDYQVVLHFKRIKADCYEQKKADAIAKNAEREAIVAINATIGIGLTVEALEAGVVKRMVAFLNDLTYSEWHWNSSARESLQNECDAILALIDGDLKP